MTFYSKKPDFKISVLRRNNGFAVEDISADISRVTTGKQLGNAAGNFSIEMVPFNLWKTLEYGKNLKLHDIIKIEFDGGRGFGFVPVLVGLIGRISESRRYDMEGRPQTRIKISGLDMGKMLVAHDCGWDLARLDIDMPRRRPVAGPDVVMKPRTWIQHRLP